MPNKPRKNSPSRRSSISASIPGPAVGLARTMSKMGFCSRSQAVQLIVQGRVTLNGSICRNVEAPVRTSRDSIAVDGNPIVAAAKIHLMLNKPRGLVTTASDEHHRPTVYDCLRSQGLHQDWLAPVGRLDKGSEGLLLLTNDSEWAARITAPATHLDKTYHVQIGVIADDPLIAALKNGIVEAGEVLRARSVSLLRHGGKNSWIEVVLDEGKNRHIRRMLATLNIEVLRLVRVAIGPLQLGDLAKGQSRPLSAEEKSAMDRAMTGPMPTENHPSVQILNSNIRH
jgi:23S rRNA pseudouridine2605 synthase